MHVLRSRRFLAYVLTCFSLYVYDILVSWISICICIIWMHACMNVLIAFCIKYFSFVSCVHMNIGCTTILYQVLQAMHWLWLRNRNWGTGEYEEKEWKKSISAYSVLQLESNKNHYFKIHSRHSGMIVKFQEDINQAAKTRWYFFLHSYLDIGCTFYAFYNQSCDMKL